MYPSIPTRELVHIITKMAEENHVNKEITKEIIMITKTAIEQNYFTFKNKYYCQNNGLTMGAPSSAILSEIYLQYLEYTEIIKVLKQYNIIGYFRYVDDIIMVYDEKLTDIMKIHTAFNKLTPTMKFTLEI
jgi:hypothetical protein